MDMAAVTGAVTGLKAAKDLLQVALQTKVAIEAAAQIGTALDRLGEVLGKLFELREELFQLQQANEGLRTQLKARDDWDASFAKYTLVTTAGGARVFEHAEVPKRYVCPSCNNDRKIQILQDRRVSSGAWDCPGCKVMYPIDARQVTPAPLRAFLLLGATTAPGGLVAAGRAARFLALMDILEAKKRALTRPKRWREDLAGLLAEASAASGKPMSPVTQVSRSQAAPTPTGANVIVLSRALVTRMRRRA